MLQESQILEKKRYFTRAAYEKFQKLYWVCNDTIYLVEKIPFKRVSYGGAGDGGMLPHLPR